MSRESLLGGRGEAVATAVPSVVCPEPLTMEDRALIGAALAALSEEYRSHPRIVAKLLALSHKVYAWEFLVGKERLYFGAYLEPPPLATPDSQIGGGL